MDQSPFELTLPRLGGARASAADLVADLPEDLSNRVVIVDCSAAEAITQSYSDELCKQVLQLRKAAGLVLRFPTQRMATHSRMAVQLRGLSGLEIMDRL